MGRFTNHRIECTHRTLLHCFMSSLPLGTNRTREFNRRTHNNNNYIVVVLISVISPFDPLHGMTHWTIQYTWSGVPDPWSLFFFQFFTHSAKQKLISNAIPWPTTIWIRRLQVAILFNATRVYVPPETENHPCRRLGLRIIRPPPPLLSVIHLPVLIWRWMWHFALHAGLAQQWTSGEH